MKISKIIFIPGLLASLFGAAVAHAQEVAPQNRPVYYAHGKSATGGGFISTTEQTASDAEVKRIRQQQTDSYDSFNKGVVQLRHKKNDEAIVSFKRALVSNQSNSNAYIGLIDAYKAKGDLKSTAQTYRTLLYPAADKKWSSSLQSDPVTLMRFALVLNQIGQKDEALKVYQEGLYRLNYTDDKPNSSQYPVMLSVNFDGRDSENVYTPARLEAAARTAIAMKTWLSYGVDKQDEAQEQLTRAIKANPRFGPAYLYRALVLKTQVHQDAGVTHKQVSEAFDTAAQMVHGNHAKTAVKAAREAY